MSARLFPSDPRLAALGFAMDSASRKALLRVGVAAVGIALLRLPGRLGSSARSAHRPSVPENSEKPA